MKAAGLRVEQTAVSLVARTRGAGPQRMLMLIFLATVYWASSILRAAEALSTALSASDWAEVSASGAILLLLVVSVGLIFYGAFTHQTLRVDTRSFQIATKALFQPIRRNAYPNTSIRSLRYGIVRQSQAEVVRGLVFDVDGIKHYLFEGIRANEADNLLKSCANFGVQTVRDPGVTMMRDIEKRGWS